MKRYIILAALTTALAACSGDHDAPAGDSAEREAVVTARIGRAASSRASESTWHPGDRIGISGSSGSRTYANCSHTTADGSGSFAPEGQAGIFIQDKTTARFTAYHPFAGEEGVMAAAIAGNTRADMQTAATQPAIDWLWAETTADYANPRLDFGFTHRMSRLSLTLVSGEATDVASITGYTLGGLSMEGTFDPSTGTARATSQPEALSINGLTVASGKALPSLILYPQTPAGDVTVSMTLGGSTYSCALPLPELTAGKDYRFTITVGKTGLTIGQSMIAEWADGGENSGTAEIAAAKIGDFFYSDGTYSSTLDDTKTCIGIVFWTIADANTDCEAPASLYDDKIMHADNPRCTHGLVIALRSIGEYAWQDPDEPVYETFQNTEHFAPANKADYKPIVIDQKKESTEKHYYILGYQNTEILRQYNAYCEEQDRSKYICQPVAKLDEWILTNPAPANTTGWFIPSMKELFLLCTKDDDIQLHQSIKDEEKQSIISNAIEAADGENPYAEGVSIWSSNEYNPSRNPSGYGWALKINIGNDIAGSDMKFYTFNAWPVLAF